MPVAQALAGLFTAPIFVLLISVFVFGEKAGALRVIAVLVGFVGIVVVLGPGQGTLRLVDFLPVFGGLFYAMGSLATQRLCANESTIAMLCGLFTLRGLIWPGSLSCGLILDQAVGSLIGVGFLIGAYLSGEPSFVAVFEYSVFIFGPFFAYVLLRQGVTLNQGIGISMIAAAGSLIALRSERREA